MCGSGHPITSWVSVTKIATESLGQMFVGQNLAMKRTIVAWASGDDSGLGVGSMQVGDRAVVSVFRRPRK